MSAGRRITASIVVSVAVAAALTACGTQRVGTGPAPAGIDAGAAPLLQKAGEVTTGAKSAKVRETISEAGEVRHAEGVLSWADGLQAVLRMELPQALKTKFGSVDTADVILGKDALYENPHADEKTTSKLLGGAHWLEYDYTTLRTQGAAGSAFVDEARSEDPILLIKALLITHRATAVGTENLDGTQAVHFTGDLTLENLAHAGALAGDAEQLQTLQHLLQARGATRDHIELWVGTDGRLLRKDQKLTTGRGPIQSSVTYSDYGVPVSVTPPAAEDTFNVGKHLPSASARPGSGTA